MADIWRKDDNVKEQPKRNIMDLSFQNNLTTQFGKLVPVFCKEFIPGDSFSITPTFSLKFQPLVFPIQTRMRAHLHFFKVRNRNLWKDWEDFIAKNKENLDPPYLDTAVTKPITGSLLDYLGVPTTLVGDYGASGVDYDQLKMTPFTADGFSFTHNSSTTNIPETIDGLKDLYLGLTDFTSVSASTTNIGLLSSAIPVEDILVTSTKKMFVSFKNDNGNASNLLSPLTSDNGDIVRPLPVSDLYTGNFIYGIFTYDDADFSVVGTQLSYSSPIVIPSVEDNRVIFDFSSLDYLPSAAYKYFRILSFKPIGWRPQNSGTTYALTASIYKNAHISFESDSDVFDITPETSPYWSSYTPANVRERIKLSALPCRAYEQIYNSFYRNAENNPYILNGVPEYNKYMPTDEGGVDANLYDFYYRNWEDDFMTTALQQPQAGIAPLVGLTGTAGTATVTLEDDLGNTSEAQASYDEEGTVTAINYINGSSLTEALADAVTYGISINDLRNVNAFQRWLEAKARGGYKYRDVIETMFGITVRYDTLDMPEFIGGASLDIMVNQISQTTPTENSPLGDYAGQASGIGTGQTINEYFDEHGFVIGILSVVPVPNYSQLLPKHFTKRDAFDYYFPQFGHIGMQPIKYNEICPVQAYQDSTEQNNVLDETFGYQRAWYDYLASTDEVHGEFRTTLRNFVLNRTFDIKPELSKEFLTVDPKQLNDVFAIQDENYDKIMGQIYFDVKAKRPIPLYGIPRLE